MQIANRTIGPGHPTYIIAEMSANHGQSFDKARKIIHAMQESGADAVKLQTYTPDTMTIDCDRDEFIVGQGTIWEGKKLYDLYKEAMTPWDWQPKLFELANNLGMDCFSTPFDRTAVDFLEDLNPPAYKIASFELVDLPLIEYVASKGRPIIMSTGMGSLAEISEAVEVVKNLSENRRGLAHFAESARGLAHFAESSEQNVPVPLSSDLSSEGFRIGSKTAGVPLALLKCTSAYPSPPEEMNLRTIPHMAAAFDVPVGLSDHTLGIAVPVAAVALGACIIEKHFTLSRNDPGPDSSFSLEPHEFKAMVDAIRTAEKALGTVRYDLTEKEQASKVFRRSLFAVRCGRHLRRREVHRTEHPLDSPWEWTGAKESRRNFGETRPERHFTWHSVAGRLHPIADMRLSIEN